MADSFWLNYNFSWDDKRVSKYLSVSPDGRKCTSITSSYSFKSSLGDVRLSPGFKYYFEVKMVKGSSFKVGISRKDIDYNLAFSDTMSGWAYYSSGYLRHNSGGSGENYGETYGEGDIIGVYVDLVCGRLFFSKNDKVFGIAYESKEFLKGELYPACCCLSKDECYELLMPQPED